MAYPNAKSATTEMGIYEHASRRESIFRLKELDTGQKFVCHSTSDCQGKKRELW